MRDRNKWISEVIKECRKVAHLSQEAIAFQLNIDRKTVQNWESGKSFPDVEQVYEWFSVCRVNPFPYYLKFIKPEELSLNADDEVIKQNLLSIINNMSATDIRCLFFILLGEHGSDPTSLLQMITANLHTPMRNRVNIANTIIDNYDIAEQCGDLTNLDQVMPDMDALKKAAALGKQATIQGEDKYSVKE